MNCTFREFYYVISCLVNAFKYGPNKDDFDSIEEFKHFSKTVNRIFSKLIISYIRSLVVLDSFDELCNYNLTDDKEIVYKESEVENV